MNPITRCVTRVFACALLFTAAHASADNHATPPAIVDYFACNFKDGKDVDDLLAARDFFVKQLDKAGITPAPAFLWEHFKGSASFDHLWLSIYDSMSTYAAALEQAAGAQELAGVNERFEAVSDCSTGLAIANTIFERKQPEGGNVSLPAFACKLNHGRSADDLKDLWVHAKNTMESLGEDGPLAMYTMQPITNGPNSPDVLIFTTHEGPTAWANYISAFNSSPAGQSLSRHARVILDCNYDIWSAQQVIGE